MSLEAPPFPSKKQDSDTTTTVFVLETELTKLKRGHGRLGRAEAGVL
jgi:hypothetical protein